MRHALTTSPVRTFEFQGCHLSFSVEGQGAPVIFIQGVGVHGHGWSPQIAAMRSRFECLSFDNRGMGLSQPPAARISVEQMASDARALLGYLGWHSAHVVGHSLGGQVALELAFTAPDCVRSLSLLCTLARGRDATRLSWRMLWLGLRSRVGSRAARRQAFLEMVMPPGSVDGKRAVALAAELEPLFGHDLAEQPPIAMPQLGALRRYDATSRLSRLADIPTLVMSAVHDPIAPPRFGRALAQGIPGARFVEISDASHGLPIHQAPKVNAFLIDHLTRIESARA